MIAEFLRPLLLSSFPLARKEIFPADGSSRIPLLLATFESDSPDVDKLEVVDDGDEVTIFLGGFTHVHIGCWDENLNEEEREKRIAQDSVHFLSRVFADEVEFYRRWWGGGCGPRGSKSGEVFLWSGRRFNENIGSET